MQEIFEQLLGYAKGIWNKRWYAMALAWLLCIIGWALIYKMPNQYETKAKIYIDTQSLLKPLLSGLTVQTNVDQQINLMVKTLLSRPNVEKIIRLADLDLGINSQEELNALILKLQREIKFKLAGRDSTNLYNLAYVDSNPEQGKDILQSVITVFIENSIGQTREDADSAKNFLNKQIQEYEKRLLDSETRLKEFKQKNIDFLPSTGQDYYSRMQESSLQLNAARLALKEAEKKMESLQAEIDGESPSIDSGLDGVSTAYDERIAIQEQNLDDLLLQYTNTHPDVMAVKRTLRGLNKKRDQEIAEIKKSRQMLGKSGADLENNPVYQQLKINLGEVTATVETLKVRVAEYTSRYENLKNMLNTIPEIEAQLIALNRDYDITKDKYNEFLSRRESAAISESVDKSTDSVQFKVIETPRVGDKPVGPNRILFSSLVLVLGMGAGIGFAFVLSQLKPVILTASDLTRLAGLPILGTVSAITSPGQNRRRIFMFMSYFSLVVFLLLVYGALVTWYSFLLNT